MKVLIETFNMENNRVIFASQYGKGMAFWDGESPKINTYYWAEIEIPELLEWDIDIKTEKSTAYMIGIQREACYFTAKVESACEDGSCIIRIGDSIVVLETEGRPFENGTYISFSSKEVTLFNTDI